MEEPGYKMLHESLISNNNGTTAFESTIVVVPSIISVYIVSAVRGLLPAKSDEAQVKQERFHSLGFFLEFFCVIMPCILSFTLMADHLLLLIIMQFMVCFVFFILNHTEDKKVKYKMVSGTFDKRAFKAIMSHRFDPKRRSFITNFRAITNLLTVLCILAVDFHTFPRRFAKTETFGYGVMDLGVGLFIIANALVAPEARSFVPVRVPLWRESIHCLPLIVLGAARVILTSKVNYQEHVTEYGLHWNFFFTLAVTKLICSIILRFVKHNTGVYILLPLLMMAFYEVILHLGVRDWIFGSAPRLYFLSANREGLASNIGYIALYFGGVSLGRVLQKWERLNAVNNWSAVKKLVFTALILWTLTVLCENTVGVSRRLANVGYCLWILAFTTTILALLLIVEFFTLLLKFICVRSRTDKPNPNITFVPDLLEAINMNGLVFFLSGNLLTGTINLCFSTFYFTPLEGFVIITLYMLVNCAFVSVLFHKKLSLKL